MAHNGVVRDLPCLEERLGEHASLVAGDTDSERLFALITKETEAKGGDVGAGITAAVRLGHKLTALEGFFGDSAREFLRGA
jgi:glutamine phosphoribosylpyrophosphate amidotransferase